MYPTRHHGGSWEDEQIETCGNELAARMERAASWEHETRHLPAGNKERDGAVEELRNAGIAGTEFMLVYS